MKQEFIASLPNRPYCTDNPRMGLKIRGRESALLRSHIQPNRPSAISTIVFDLDCEDAYFRPEERGLPPPTFISVRRGSGHAHVGYMLESPVMTLNSSSLGAQWFLEAVERGMGKRLGADACYRGLICKNPTHPEWETDWQAQQGYDLHRLNDYLDRADKVKAPKKESMSGLGRNCTVFEELSAMAYRQVIGFKQRKQTLPEFRLHLEGLAVAINSQFRTPLYLQELGAIAKSVAKWTWEKFTLEKFSAIQSRRGRKAWSKTQTLTSQKPWQGEGVSRATYYRQRSQASHPHRGAVI